MKSNRSTDRVRRSNSNSSDDSSDEPDSRDQYQMHSSAVQSKFTPFPDLIAVQSFVSNDTDQPSSSTHSNANVNGHVNPNEVSSSIRQAPDISIVPGRANQKHSYINFDSLNANKPSSSAINASASSSSTSSSSQSLSSSTTTTSPSSVLSTNSSSNVVPSTSGHHPFGQLAKQSSPGPVSFLSASASASSASSASSSSTINKSNHNHFISSTNEADLNGLACGSSGYSSFSLTPLVASAGASSAQQATSSSFDQPSLKSTTANDLETTRAIQSALHTLQQSVDRIYRSIDQRLQRVESKLDLVSGEIRRAQNERDMAPHVQAADSLRDELQQFQRDQRQIWDREKRDMLRMFAALFRNASDQLDQDD